MAKLAVVVSLSLLVWQDHKPTWLLVHSTHGHAAAPARDAGSTSMLCHLQIVKQTS